MPDQEPRLTANPGYAIGQLHRALRAVAEHPDPAVRARAAEKIRRWENVLAGMATGSLEVGSRTPLQDVPAWVTLEVAHGGFATGALMAGGPLQPHEEALLARIGRSPGGGGRATLNEYFVSDQGQRELMACLRTGTYRVQVPEEGALLVVAWLLERGEAPRALDLLEALAPFVDRLRFYPVPDPRPLLPSSVVHLRTVAQAMENLEAVRPRPQIEQMNETLRHWHPLYDRAVGLFLETVRGETPSLRTVPEGTLARRPDGQCYVDGGWPCQQYPEGWRERALGLLEDYRRLRETHALCCKPEDPKENFARLRSHLARCVNDPSSLSGRDVGYVRKILASFVTRHGAPGSEALGCVRAAQAQVALRPSNPEYARVLIDRLRPYPGDAGLGNLEGAIGPLSATEASRLRAAPGGAIPESLGGKVVRCLEAPVEELVERGVIPSGEVLAIVLPQITGQVRAAVFDDPDLRRLYGALYAAFRRRRSLLLLDLAHQVGLEELPWVASLMPLRRGGLDERARARETLRQVTVLVVASFPEAILPNKLLQEMRALASTAGLTLPLVDELAADIFMGAFSEKFLRAAQVAARTLRGTLYPRYYDIPTERVLALDDAVAPRGTPASGGFAALCSKLAGLLARGGAPASGGFAALCCELAGVDWGSPRSDSVARNGTIIEQEQILTTHNLAVLFDALDLCDVLGQRLPELAQKCFVWICRRLQIQVPSAHARLVCLKNSAYAWRQMLFYLSLAGEAECEAFVPWADQKLAEQDEVFQQLFRPALEGLRLVAAGGRFDARGCGGTGGSARRFLGWSTGNHWLFGKVPETWERR
ncbi:MAG: hypothetical protein HY720_32095 [Planctomycetes bacterium]|nr:hypothetical protein [Planctomycetota bacterium]